MKITDLDEGIFDLLSRGASASGLNNIGNMAGKTQADMNTVARKAKELIDQGMPQQRIIQTLQQEFGVNPQAARQAWSMASTPGLVDEGDNFDLSPQQRKIANLGRVLMDQATTTKDDALSNVMAKVGNELTNFGATFGPKNLNDLVKKTDVPAPVIQKLLAYADKIYTAQTNLVKDHKKGGLNDSIEEGLGNFIRNLVGDVRNAFKPGIAVTPNMVKSMEAALAKLQAGEPISDRERQMFDTFLSTTMARELNKTFGININETTSAGSIASVAAPVGGLIARQPRNNNGTAQNALDSNNNLMGGPKKKKKSKKA